MVTTKPTPTTLEERQANAKVKALSEGVRVALIESTETTARYVARSTTHPGIAYQVTLNIAEGSDECNCPGGSHGNPCKHLAAAELMFMAQIDLAFAKEARLESAVSQADRDKLERELAEIGL